MAVATSAVAMRSLFHTCLKASPTLGSSRRHLAAPLLQLHHHCHRLHAAAAMGSTLPEIIQTSGVPVYLYANKAEVEPEALQQLISLAESPLPVGYVSAMPDVHVGKGVTIGTVFASKEYVAPMAVGVDIGCGMCAVPFDGLRKDTLSTSQLQQMQALIKEAIPTGFAQHPKPLDGATRALQDISDRKAPSDYLAEAVTSPKAAHQLGTLGGGNHFLEVVYDETDRVWVMLHSGSRNIGNVTATHYDRLAKAQLKRRRLASPGGLNFFHIDSEEGQQYLQDMAWCQEYAFENRRFMLHLMVDIVERVAKGSSACMDEAVNIHHNFWLHAAQDPKTGQEVEEDLWVTRKGATPAALGQLGLIPGSMAAGSFVTRGRGNSQSWQSCSHGAGRRMSRTRARAAISQEAFQAAMAGVVCDTDARVRDEAPQAYKDLSQVMAHQADLVDVVHRLKPLLNVKGF